MEGLMVLFGLALAGIAFLLPIVSFLLALGNQRRLRALEETVVRLQGQLNALEPRARPAQAAPVAEAWPAPAASVARAPVPVPREAQPAPPPSAAAAATAPPASVPPVAPIPPVPAAAATPSRPPVP